LGTGRCVRFTLDPTDDQSTDCWTHFGARRKAIQRAVATLKGDIAAGAPRDRTGQTGAFGTTETVEHRQERGVASTPDNRAGVVAECSKKAYAGIRGAVDEY